MKKCLLTILLISTIGFLIVPQVSLAVWYNPFSWFAPKIKKVETTKTEMLPTVNLKKQAPKTTIKKAMTNIAKPKQPAEVEQKSSQQPAVTVKKQPVPQPQSTVQQQAFEAKQNKLYEINKQIANLNAKYAADLAEAQKLPVTLEMNYIDLKTQELKTKYNIDYATLQAQFQQVQYSN